MNSRSTYDACRFSALQALWYASRSSISMRMRRLTFLHGMAWIIAWIHLCVSKNLAGFVALVLHSAIGRDVGEALAAYPVPALSAAITQRVVFAEAAAQG